VLDSSTSGGLNKIGGIDITTHQGTQFGNLGKNKEFDVSIPRGYQFDNLGRSTENKGFAHIIPTVLESSTVKKQMCFMLASLVVKLTTNGI